MNCPNCGTALTCGCQRKVAFDGTQCCASCVTDYENKQNAKNKVVTTLITPEPIIHINAESAN